MAVADVLAALQERFPDIVWQPQPLVRYVDGRDSDQIWVRVEPERLLEVMQFLRDDPRCRFEMLADLAGIDYLNFPDADDRYGIVYNLLSITHNQRLWVKVFVNDPDPQVPSVFSIWNGANWPEREVFDLLGVTFVGHPDLRRILCPEHFEDHPLRKDYPLRGKGERENFRRLTRQ